MSPEQKQEIRERRRLMSEDKEARKQEMIAHLADLALNAKHEETQVAAANAWLNRVDGLPVQVNKNENRDMTFEELVKASMRRPPAIEADPGV